MGEYVIALDQGTTSSRTVLIDRLGRIKGMSQSSFPQLFPQPGWVEHSPKDILSSQLKVLAELLVSTGVSASKIDSIGITNQRRVLLLYGIASRADPFTTPLCGNAVAPPKSWNAVARMRKLPLRQCRTGLIPDAYYSASKIASILDAVPGARAARRSRRAGFRHGGFLAYLESNPG